MKNVRHINAGIGKFLLLFRTGFTKCFLRLDFYLDEFWMECGWFCQENLLAGFRCPAIRESRCIKFLRLVLRSCFHGYLHNLLNVPKRLHCIRLIKILKFSIFLLYNNWGKHVYFVFFWNKDKTIFIFSIELP